MLQAGKCPLAAYPLLPTALQGVTWTTRWSTAQHQSIAHKGCSILAGSTTPQLFWHRVSLFGAWGAAFPAHPLCRGAPKAHCHLQELCMGSWKGSFGATELSTVPIYGPHLQLVQLMGLKARQHPPSSLVHHSRFPLRNAEGCPLLLRDS